MNAYNNLIANASKVSQNTNVNPIKKVDNLQNGQNVPSTSFNEVLQGKIEEINTLQFSKHASLRINSRDINLSNEQLERVEGGVNQARQKGIKDSLVLVDDVALLVNIPSRTVVTAINQGKQNIFTNIDGAVVV